MVTSPAHILAPGTLDGRSQDVRGTVPAAAWLARHVDGCRAKTRDGQIAELARDVQVDFDLTPAEARRLALDAFADLDFESAVASW